jgi:hypothetical protein
MDIRALCSGVVTSSGSSEAAREEVAELGWASYIT